MARNIHSNYFEDNYIKHECQDCRRSFIVGQTLSKGMEISCPYCRSVDVQATVEAGHNTEDMDMGCLGIYFKTYEDNSPMLYTHKEINHAINSAIKNGIRVETIETNSFAAIIEDYCRTRDGKPKRKAEP